jgi:hypothetical protein
MESRPRLPLSEYWYPGALDRSIDATLRAACTLTWPYALYCATRFHRDIHVAHELMDEALPKAERYILRSGRERELKQVCYRLLSLVKRLSRQRLRHAELPAGLLSDLEQITHQLGTSTPQEASAYLNQLLSRMSPQTRQIIHWRAAGHSFRQIAKELHSDHATIIRAYNRELRELVRPSASRKLSEQDQDDG